MVQVQTKWNTEQTSTEKLPCISGADVLNKMDSLGKIKQAAHGDGMFYGRVTRAYLTMYAARVWTCLFKPACLCEPDNQSTRSPCLMIKGLWSLAA